MKIPFHVPYFSGKEQQLVIDAIQRGSISGDGFYTKKVKELLEKMFQVHHVLLTTSGTHALELAVLLTDIQPGDEVIMPSFTFPSTANAVLLRGGKPVFAEIEPVTLNLDPEDLDRKITNRTRAVIPVHYAGIGCRMDEINRVALKHQLTVIEDAAQGVNALYRDRYLGTWGDFGCFSFHGTKNFTSGEGGALLINRADHELIQQAEIMLQKGTNRISFLRGEVDKYSWIDIGSSYTPSDILMALLYAQLREADSITVKRRHIHEFYTSRLQKYVDAGRLQFTQIPDPCRSNYHLFYLLFSDETTRDRVKAGLKAEGVESFTHYVPLHSSPMGLKLGYQPQDLPMTEKAGCTLLRLPMSTGLSEAEMEYTVTAFDKVMQLIKESV